MRTTRRQILVALTQDERRKRGQAALIAALKQEQTAVVAYEAIANSGRLSVRATTLLRTLQDQDNQHAQQLVAALDAQGVKPPFPPRRAAIPGLSRVHDDLSAASFALALEGRAVAAYNEVVRYLPDPNLLRTVSGAMGADGQHLVVLRQLARREPVPTAFEVGI